MARQKSIASIDTEIIKAETELAKVQEKYDKLSVELQNLQKQRCEQEAKLILEAYGQSGKSFNELMIVINTRKAD